MSRFQFTTLKAVPQTNLGQAFFVCLLLLASCFVSESYGADTKRPTPQEPVIAPASDEAQSQIGTFKIPDKWKCEVFAAEPDVANPVVLTVDAKGRVFVCESYRQNKGVTDNRGHDDKWLRADLAAMTVQDRIDYHRKLLGDQAYEYESQLDRIKLLIDSDGDGKADKSTVFASGFNAIEEGTGAGILVRGNQAFYTCIPKLWTLTDSDGDGVAEEQKVVADGFGVRVAFRGHDMHGLVMGPDGRLYFSIGDRGYHVETPNGLLANPESGAVFRCELDGSNLEVFATGLRNPQELAFDEFGNLFSVDNNSDSGDKARWVYVVPGGDTGWRMMYQYLPDRGPFNREKIWYPYSDETPAYIVPPVDNFSDGPSGFMYYPGTGLDDSFSQSFLLCDFRGQPSNSGIHKTKLKAKGAFFEIGSDEKLVWQMLATDVEMGPDGSVYVTDWVNGWNGEGKGRVYRFFDPVAQQSTIAKETQAILKEGVGKSSEELLKQLINHADRRIRYEAQWELAKRGRVDIFAAISQDKDSSELAKVHSIWGLGQVARGKNAADKAISVLSSLLESKSRASLTTECVGAVLWNLTDAYGRLSESQKKQVAGTIDSTIAQLLNSSEPRIGYHAALAVGRIGSVEALPSILQLLEKNKDQDPIIRHACIMALAGHPDLKAIGALSSHPSESVRVAAVVALRKKYSPLVANFLNDAVLRVQLEAARAVHDVPELHSELAKLAVLINSPTDSDPLLRRVLNANYRLGSLENAVAVARFAASSARSESLRKEALAMLDNWAKPNDLDRVMNRHLPLKERDASIAANAMRPVLPQLLKAEGDLKANALKILANLKVTDVIPALVKVIEDKNAPGDDRSSAVASLVGIAPDQAKPKLATLVNDLSPAVRITALEILSGLEPTLAIDTIKRRVNSEVMIERQASWDLLKKLKSPEADKLIADGVERFLAGSLPQDCWLNVIESAEGRLESELQKKLEAQRESIAKKSDQQPAVAFADCAIGGSIAKGRDLFYGRSQLSCVRCHKVGDNGGEVGPNLTVIGTKKAPDYLVEAIVAPNAKIAEGFETLIVQTDEGQVFSGILKSETDQELKLLTPENAIITIEKESIEGTKKGQSSMPTDLMKYMSRRELRDLIAYLAALDGTLVEKKDAGHK